MKTKTIASVIFVLFFLLSACGQAEIQNENLPAGMKSGYWSDNDINGFVFFSNGYFTNDGGEAFGTYTLVDDDTILLKWLDRTEQLNIAVAESGERIVISRSGKEDDIFTLAIPDTSSGNLEKDIIGEWKSYGDLSFIKDENDSFFIEFKRNGDIIFSDSEETNETGTYEFVGGKIIIETEEGTLLYSGFSLGDLIYLADIDRYTKDLDNFQWVFLVRK